jgi:hypothetical protein
MNRMSLLCSDQDTSLLRMIIRGWCVYMNLLLGATPKNRCSIGSMGQVEQGNTSYCSHSQLVELKGLSKLSVIGGLIFDSFVRVVATNKHSSA